MKQPEIKKVLVIGSGPAVIGRSAEFDYAGTQALRTLKEEGLKTILINSNPSTVMTDKGLADQIYLEPLNIDIIKRIIEKEKPDSILPTVGGNLALELGLGLSMNGFLEEHQVRLLGVSPEKMCIRDSDRGEAPGCSVYHGVSYFVYRQYGADSFHFAIYQKDICLAAPLSPLGKNH